MSVTALSEAQQRYLYLVRLAWNLHLLGLGPYVELPRHTEPAVVIPLATGRVRVTASRRRHGWIYRWGRSRVHLARADAEFAARQIAAQVGA